MIIYAGYFTAGLEFEGNIVCRAAPIIKYMIGWDKEKIISYCGYKNWKYKICQEN